MPNPMVATATAPAVAGVSSSSAASASSVDGDAYVHRLAQFVQSNERRLAAVQHGGGVAKSARLRSGLDAYLTLPFSAYASGSSSAVMHAVTLHLTPHHLFYLLDRMENLGANVGPLDVRCDMLGTRDDHDAGDIYIPGGDSGSSEYVSFLHGRRHLPPDASDGASIRSVSTVQSAMSGISSVWTRMTMSARSIEARRHAAVLDLKYLLSAFTKLPSLRMAPDARAAVIDGYEEFPFETAVPLVIFKNLSSLEIAEYGVRSFYGWDVLAKQLRSLVVRRAKLHSVDELLVHVAATDDPDSAHPLLRRRHRTKHSDVSLPSLAATAAAAAAAAGGGSRSSNKSRSNADGKDRTGSVALKRTSTNSSGSSGSSLPIARSRSGSASTTASPPGSEATTMYTSGGDKWRFLQYLALPENGLTDVGDAIGIASSLRALNLSHNALTVIPASLTTLPRLQSLNIAYNRIESLEFLWEYELPGLRTLVLRGNRIRSLAGIERLSSLERVDLRDNALSEPLDLAVMTRITRLRQLWVTGNPLCRTHSSSYRVTIYNLFRQDAGSSANVSGSDILLDDSLPGLLERRGLVEFATKAMAAPAQEPAPTPAPVLAAPSLGPTQSSAPVDLATVATQAGRRQRRVVHLDNVTPIPPA